MKDAWLVPIALELRNLDDAIFMGTLLWKQTNKKKKTGTATDQWWIWRTEQTHLEKGLVQKLHIAVNNEKWFIFLKHIPGVL